MEGLNLIGNGMTYREFVKAQNENDILDLKSKFYKFVKDEKPNYEVDVKIQFYINFEDVELLFFKPSNNTLRNFNDGTLDKTIKNYFNELAEIYPILQDFRYGLCLYYNENKNKITVDIRSVLSIKHVDKTIILQDENQKQKRTNKEIKEKEEYNVKIKKLDDGTLIFVDSDGREFLFNDMFMKKVIEYFEVKKHEVKQQVEQNPFRALNDRCQYEKELMRRQRKEN